jgi:hypothetical protein
VLADHAALEDAGESRPVVGRALDQAGELGRVGRQQLEDGFGHLADPDQVGLVVGEDPGRGVREPGEVAEEDVELLSLLEDRAAGGGGVAQDADQVRRGVGVGVGDIGQEDEVLAQGRQVVVDRTQVGVELLEGLAELLAPPG